MCWRKVAVAPLTAFSTVQSHKVTSVLVVRGMKTKQGEIKLEQCMGFRPKVCHEMMVLDAYYLTC